MKIIGIYKIISPNGRIYIGQSINIYERLVHHKIRNDERHTKLNRSFNKYGVDNHTFEIIEECEIEELNIKERFWQDYYDVLNKGLNCILTKTSDQSGKLSEATKLKISKARKGKYSGVNCPFYGRTHSEESKLKLRNAHLGEKSHRFGKKDSEETIRRKSIAQSRGKGSSAKKVIDTKTNKTWECLKDAAEELNINYSTLKTWMRGPENKNKTNLKYIMKKTLVSVYGSLRFKMHNHNHYLKDAKLMGTYTTEPIYNLHSLGSFPALKLNGNHSIVMEVYEVDEETLKNLNRLEGYYPGEKSTFYDRIEINTPWGRAFTYIYVNELSKDSIVESGDWVAYKNKEKSWFSVTNN